jgi:hypothetical protein
MNRGNLIIITLALFVIACEENNELLPSVKRVNGKIEILNCEKPWNENSMYTCPMLFCHKSIWESGEIKGKYKLVSFEERRFGEGKPFIISGQVEYEKQINISAPTRYRCLMKDNIVIQKEILSEENWLKKTDSGEFWKI